MDDPKTLTAKTCYKEGKIKYRFANFFSNVQKNNSFKFKVVQTAQTCAQSKDHSCEASAKQNDGQT